MKETGKGEGAEVKHSRQRKEHESSFRGIKRAIVPAIPTSPKDFHS